MTDSQRLVAAYVKDGSEPAFRELVARYLDLVYSSALRIVNGDTHRAQDVAQIVFADLARQARSLSREVMLGGWLHRHTCFVAATLMRGERRRQNRERLSLDMNAPDQQLSFDHIAPLLDEAINQLGADDRAAILLRFFEQRDFRSVGEALGNNEEAARKRVNRALEKLHSLLKRRGVVFPVAALAAALTSGSVKAAPAGLAAGISKSVLTGAAIGTGATLKILNLMALGKLKLALAGAILVAGIVTPLVIQQRAQTSLQSENESLRRQLAELKAMPSGVASPALPDDPPALSNDQLHELLRLRGEVTRLRNASPEITRVPTDPVEPEMQASLARVRQLKDWMAQNPGAKIPEFQLLSDADWLNALGKDGAFDTDADYRVPFARLRDMAKRKFAPLAMAALAKYAAANDNHLPDDPSQLKPYFDTAVDDALFDRYKMLHTGQVADLPSPHEKVMAEKGPVDEAFDSSYTVGLGSWGNSGVGFAASPDTFDNYLDAVKAFKEAHAGHGPAVPADLQPFFKRPVDEAALQKVFQKFDTTPR